MSGFKFFSKPTLIVSRNIVNFCLLIFYPVEPELSSRKVLFLFILDSL